MSENTQITAPQPEKRPGVNFSQETIRAAEGEAVSWLNPQVWNLMGIVAKTFIEAGALPIGIKTAPQLMMILQAGREAGMGPIESVNAFYIVNGKITMYGDRVISQVAKAGHKIEWGKCDSESATVKITRGDNGTSHEETYTLKQAEKAGLLALKNGMPGPWNKFPERMLKYRVFGNVAHFIVPDALGGVAVEGEAEAVEVEIKEPGNAALAPGNAAAGSLAAALEPKPAEAEPEKPAEPAESEKKAAKEKQGK